MSDFWNHVLGRITPEQYEQRKLLSEVLNKGMITRWVKYESTLDYLESKGCNVEWDCPPSGNHKSKMYRISLY